jgi:hypothetical protein
LIFRGLLVRNLKSAALVSSALFAITATTACGGESAVPPANSASAGGALEAAAPTPSPTAAAVTKPTPSGYIASPSLDGAAPLQAAFDVEDGLKLAWGTGAIPDLYDANEGAFRFTCGGDGDLAYEDPLFYPGQPGESHLQQVWGNTDFDARTTPASLAASNSTNCNDTPLSANRSSYWMPALVNDKGEAIRPDLVSVYYKRKTSASTFCDPKSAIYMGKCIGLPNQIRFVFGWDATHPTAKVKGASWYCTGGTGKHYSNLDDVFASGCTVGDLLLANTVAPNCWDGEYLDTPDHRSHMAYGSYGSWGYYKCPASHPYVIPQEENKMRWTVTADMIAPDKTSRVRLSSDHMLPGAKPGETLHADYIEAWVGSVKDMWLDNCIEKALSCSGGDLGNGKQLIGASQPRYGWTNPNPRILLSTIPQVK